MIFNIFTDYIQTQMYLNQLNTQDRTVIHQFFENKKIAKLLYSQIKEIYAHSISQAFVFKISIENQHLHIVVHSLIRREEEKPIDDNGSTYLIRITRAFPLSGVRVYALNHYLHPKINDCRDLTDQLLGMREWSHKRRLINLIEGIQSFEEKLIMRHQKYLSVQKTGKFVINDLFSKNQLKMFSSLELFVNELSEKQERLVGVTDTHMLIFQKCQLNKEQSNRPTNYRLIRGFDLQCITQIGHKYQTPLIYLVITKYKINANFNDYKKYSVNYSFKNYHQFLRKVLDNIWKFQRLSMNLTLSGAWEKQKGFKEIEPVIEQSIKLQENLQRIKRSSKQLQIQGTTEQVVNLYHKIIDYFSERGDIYYLVYVNKINQIC